LQASQVVVMVLKGVAQLELIFPTDLQALNDTKALEQRNRPIDTGAIDDAFGSERLVEAWSAVRRLAKPGKRLDEDW